MVARGLIAVVLALAAGAALAADGPQAQTATQQTRTGLHPDLTRIVLDVSQLTKFYTEITDEGRRILVGIPSVDWETNRHRLTPHGLVDRYDFVRRGLKRGLLVIYTKAPARIEHKFTLPPDPADNKGNRLVIDLVDRDHKGKVPMPRRVQAAPKAQVGVAPEPKPQVVSVPKAPAPAPVAAKPAPAPVAKPSAATPEPGLSPAPTPAFPVPIKP